MLSGCEVIIKYLLVYVADSLLYITKSEFRKKFLIDFNFVYFDAVDHLERRV